MKIFIPFTLFAISTVCGAGEFSVLHHAPSLIFKGHDPLKESTLKEVYAASLGFSIEHFSSWKGLYMSDPFGVAQAIVTVYVDGVSDINQQKGHRFLLKTDVSEYNLYESLQKRIGEHFPNVDTHLVRIHLSDGLEEIRKYPIFKEIGSSGIKEISHEALKLDVDEDRTFLKEMTLLSEIAHIIQERNVKIDATPAVFWFDVSSLHALTDLYGENSTQVLEAKQILSEIILEINSAFIKMYDGYVLVNVVTSDASHTRRGRSILESRASEEISDKSMYNLASYYDKDYPVIFNIILWFAIVMLFALIAICIAIGSMDPGRDSIIYRMTSTRMKKDN